MFCDLIGMFVSYASVFELFRDIPQGVRYGRELDVPPALTEAELQRHLEELAAKNVVDEVCFLGAGIYDHYVPAVVDAVLQRGELLTAYTPYQPEMSQGVLQAIFEYQTAICELTGMDVSNASGLRRDDGRRRRVLRREARDRPIEDRRHRGDEPAGAPGREDLRAGLRARGGRGAARGRRDRSRPRARGGRRGAAAVIFQQPNFFGCLEPAPELAAAANDAGALPIAHVDLVSLGVLEAPGNYGCALAIGEGQSAGNSMSYGGPHYGFLAARIDYIRRLPGRIVGETVDAAGERGYVLTLQTREQHIRREKATSNITTNQTLLALAGLVHLCLLGPQGLRELGETCMALAGYAKERLAGARARACVSREGNVQGVCRPHRTERARGARGGARAGRLRRLPARPRLPGSRRRAARRRDREADGRGDRPARRGARAVKLIYEKSQAGPPRARRAAARTCRCPRCRPELARKEPPRLPELAEPEVLRHFTELSTRNFGIDTGFYPLGSCTMKYNPRVNERLVGLPGFARPASARRGRRGAGRARARVGAAGDPARGDRPRRRRRCSRPRAARAS